MLLLTRRTSESIVIGDSEVNIIILGVNGGQVRLGIDAPKSISIHRKEIYLKVKEEGLCPIKPNQLSQNRKYSVVN